MAIELLDLDNFHGNTSDAPREMRAELGLSRDFYFAQRIRMIAQEQSQQRQELPILQINIFPLKKDAPPETPVKRTAKNNRGVLHKSCIIYPSLSELLRV
jgi:hypothetical protein